MKKGLDIFVCIDYTIGGGEKLMKITLRAARVNKGLTQKEMAELVGVNNTTILKWEKGETYPDVINIRKIEEVLGVKYDDIIFL